MTFISVQSHLAVDQYQRHALYAWVSPSPRVRCRKAFVTYLLTYRYFAVGHGRRSPSIPKSVDRRPPWQVAHHQRAAIAGCRQAQAGGVPRIARGLEGNKDKHILGFLVNSETRHRGSEQPNLGTLGFLVNSETRHRGSEQPNFGVVFIQ